MDRVWDTSKYPRKSFVTLWQVNTIRGHKVNKVTFKLLGWDGVIHVFGSDFRQGRENELLE